MTRTLRIVSFNAAIQDIRFLGRSLYCPVPWPRERLRRLPAALLALGADVLCLQEMFHRPLQDWLCRELAGRYPHVAGLTARGPTLRLGNELLVFSRHPLRAARLHRFRAAAVEERHFTSKGFLHVQVEVPGLGAVDLVNFHTTAGGARAHPESPAMESIRRHQVRQLLQYASGLALPLLVGDLNAGPHTSRDIYKEVLDAGHEDAFAAAGADGMTWDPGNPLVAGGREAHLPPQRIDHVLPGHALAARTRAAAGAVTLAACEVDTPRGAVPLSDHYAVALDLRY